MLTSTATTGAALLQGGQFAEALASTLRALELLPLAHSLRPIVLRQLQQCRQMVSLK